MIHLKYCILNTQSFIKHVKLARLVDVMSDKRKGPSRPPPPNGLNGQAQAASSSIFDQREKLHERGEKLGNLAQLTEPIDPSKNYSDSPEELW